MIFDSVLENTNSEIDLTNVTESAYECGLEGAFMHVYENECNYNALMRADADICLFADDDMVYEDNYVEIIENAFRDNPYADVIVFISEKRLSPVS